MDEQPDLRDERAYYTRLESPVDYVPQHVVSLVPSLTEALFALDLARCLIAVSSVAANCI